MHSTKSQNIQLKWLLFVAYTQQRCNTMYFRMTAANIFEAFGRVAKQENDVILDSIKLYVMRFCCN